MNNVWQLAFSLCLVILLSACNDASLLDLSGGNEVLGGTSASDVSPSVNKKSKPSVQSKPDKPKKKLPKSAFKTLQWTDLMPKEDLDAILSPPSYINEIEDGSAEDQISSQIQSTIAAASDDRYQQALVSTNVVSEMDGKAIRLPGFIVPLEFDDDQTITQFFLVPFFGACIHVPPPPPNQIIFVEYPEGLKLDALYDPFWISGVVKTSLIQNDLATAAYSLKMQYYEHYTE